MSHFKAEIPKGDLFENECLMFLSYSPHPVDLNLGPSGVRCPSGLLQFLDLGWNGM